MSFSIQLFFKMYLLCLVEGCGGGRLQDVLTCPVRCVGQSFGYFKLWQQLRTVVYRKDAIKCSSACSGSVMSLKITKLAVDSDSSF